MAPPLSSSVTVLAMIMSLLRLAALAALATALTVGPAMSQHRQGPSAAQADNALIGLPIFSSDGEQIGKVVEIGIDDDDQALVVAEIERPLGFGADAVAIPTGMFVQRADRIELTITAAQVRDILAKAEREQ